MKAFLLAAGTGSRLRPLTDRMPKCLLRVGGRTLLDRWLDALWDAGADEVLVNLHHLADAVAGHLAARTGPPAVRTVHEPVLLGSAGTLAANRRWVEGEELLLACNADNLTDFDLRTLVARHRARSGTGTVATVAVFRAEDPSACGVVEVDGDGRMTGYEEKPAHPVGDLANAGIYAFDPSVLDEVGGPPPRDVGYHLLPRLVGRAQVVPVDGYFRDIGTPDAFARAQVEWEARDRRVPVGGAPIADVAPRRGTDREEVLR